MSTDTPCQAVSSLDHLVTQWISTVTSWLGRARNSAQLHVFCCPPRPMEMYAARKHWDIGGVEVACEYTPAERGCPTRFGIVVRLPDSLTDEQVERLRVIAAKCPVHRTLDGEVMFDERVERVSLAH